MRNYRRIGGAKWSVAVFALAAFLGAAGCGGGDNQVGFKSSVGVSPTKAVVSAGQSQAFHSQNLEGGVQRYSWKIKEGDTGGTIVVVRQENAALDEMITYTAPQTPGTYHVQVTGTYPNGDTKTAEAAVEVK